MDKNTISGILLIAAVFLVFMWLSPRDEQQQPVEETQQISEAKKEAAETLRPDTLSQKQIGWLKESVAEQGESIVTADGIKGKRVEGSGYDLTLVGDSLTGNVKVGAKNVAVERLLAADTTLTVADRREAVANLDKALNNITNFGKLGRFASGESKQIALQNDVLSIAFNTKGGSIDYAELKKYKTEYNPDETKKTSSDVVLFDGRTNTLAFSLPGYEKVSTSDLYFVPEMRGDSSVLMKLEFPGGAYWGIRYTLGKGDSYLVRIDIEQNGMDKVLAGNSHDLTLNWRQALRRQEKGRMFEERNSGVCYKYKGGNFEELSTNGDDAQDRKSLIKWVAYKNQFFSSVLIADNSFSRADFASVELKDDYFLKFFSSDITVNNYDWSKPNPTGFTLYLGPNKYSLLSSLDDKVKTDEDLKLTRLIPLGWSMFRWINTCFVIPVFNFLGGFGWNYGIVILIMTIIIKLILFPLSYKSYKSQAKMKILAPEVKAINEKYPGTENAMVRQQKTMALYSKAGASPLSGCLPMLLQMPILFAMFSFFPSCIDLRGQSFLWAHDLAAPDAIISWNTNIPIISTYFGNHISLFCLLMTVTNIIYTKITMASQPSQGGMKWMMYMMPVFFLVFFNNYAAGLSYYYFLSLLITIMQTFVIRRFVVKEEDVRREMAANAKKPRKKSGFMARLEEAQRRQQEQLRQAQKAKERGKRR